jgi:hypothetical protein
MRRKSHATDLLSEEVIKDIRRATRKHYSAGAHTNLAESYFARLRRMIRAAAQLGDRVLATQAIQDDSVRITTRRTRHCQTVSAHSADSFGCSRRCGLACAAGS